MWRLLLGTMGVKSLVQGLNAAATAGFEPRTVWSEVRRRNRLATAFFNCLRPPLITIVTSKADACFRATYFNSFHAKSLQNSKVFCFFHEGCPKWNLLWKFGLHIPPDGVLVTVFVSHSSSCFIHLKKTVPPPLETPMVSFDLVFH